jgi:hypothetical protein
MKEKASQGLYIRRTIPYACVLTIESTRTDRFEISGRVLDQYGGDMDETKTIEIRAPKGDTGSQFQSTMNQCSDVIDQIRSSEAPLPDLSYLEKMPESLTRNAVLDLNTVLRDQPVHDELVHEAAKFLGNEPFLLEESLRAGNDRENGVLFAAGKNGYYWIQGKKQGRFMSDVIVDTVEWENVRGFTYPWHRNDPTIYATYSLTKDGQEITVEYQWSPVVNDDTLQYPWLLQQLNGSLILADILNKYSGKPRLVSPYNEF